MRIFFEEDNMPGEDIRTAMEEAADLCAQREGLDPKTCQVSVTLATPEEIQILNRDYRGSDKVTDVLSFPQFAPEDFENGIMLPPEDGEEGLLLGDVVICSEKAEEQAGEYGHSYKREMVYLFVHSMFHLLGHDHMEEDEKKEMRRGEDEIMELLAIGRE